MIEADEPAVHVEGNNDFVSAVDVTWLKNELNITFSQQADQRNPTVKVYVKNLKRIQAEEGARIITTKPLRTSENILLAVHDESLVKIASYGKIRVFNLGQVSVKKVSYKE